MAEQYWVGDFFIDVSRNQITQSKESQTLAPKALAVLTYLAENQGKVVSHDALLSEVWHNTVVSPNTLQRSIAQLRKALGEDGKAYIKTHAKQGYSLECDVRWDDAVPFTKLPVESKKTRLHLFPILMVIVSLVVIGATGFHLITLQDDIQFSVGEFKMLTTTDNREMASLYSPDGQYVVFHRYSEEFCINNIWAKNTTTQQEFQLTKDLDVYGSHSFSKDGNALAFIQEEDCEELITQKKCFKLVTLDFNKALHTPQRPNTLMECINSEIRNPQWLNNNHIAMLQKTSERWKLISYSVEEDTSKTIYTVNEGNIIDYDYSARDDLIALTSIHADGLYYIDLVKPDGQTLSSAQIKYPEEIPQHRLVYPNFSPFEDQLIFSTGRQLFTLSFDGQVTNISLPIDEPMSSPTFHPNGDRMLVIKGYYDSDIVSVPLERLSAPQSSKVHSSQNPNFTVLERSNVGESGAIFQPNNGLIAFISGRSGERQIWLTNDYGLQQLTHFPMDTFISGFDWAEDSMSLLINANNQLTQVFLDGSTQPFLFNHPVEKLFQWDSENQTALALLRVKGTSKFAEVDLTNADVHFINDKKVKWALKSKSGQLVYTDHMDRYWQPGPAEDQLIDKLIDQGNEERFLIHNDVVYGINENLELWSYDLNTQSFQVIADVPSNTDYLSDISQSELLMTVRIAGSKEVAELIVND